MSNVETFFEYHNDFLKEDDIQAILKDYDIILPMPEILEGMTVREKLAEDCGLPVVEKLEDAIRESRSSYLSALTICLNGCLFTKDSIFEANEEVSSSFLSWKSDVENELAQRRISGDTVSVILGILLRVWVMQHPLKVFEMKTIRMDPADAYNNERIVEKKHRMIELSIQDLLAIYRSGNYVDIFPFQPREIDFDGKIPVWICWWQGFDDVPELVQLCRASLSRHLDASKFFIVEISVANVADYMTFPDWVLSKYEDGKISLAHLSDILRMGLLYYYGGLWVDATYLMTEDFPLAYLQEREYFSIRLEEYPWRADICQGWWSENFLYFQRGNFLPRFVLNAFYYFYLQNEELFDYFTADHFIAIAYENFPQVKEMVDECPLSQPGVFSLRPRMNEPYDRERFREIKENTSIFKLTYRDNYKKENLIGVQTIYGHLLDKYMGEV